MAAPNEEFFSTLRYWLVIGGIITRSACGMTTRGSASLGRRPTGGGAAQRLRNDDEAQRLARPQADGGGRLKLSLRYRENAAAHDLGDKGGGVGGQRGEQRDEFRHQHEAAAEIEAATRRDIPRGGQRREGKRHDRQYHEQQRADGPDRRVPAAAVTPPPRPPGEGD